jgi:hypothetical protein
MEAEPLWRRSLAVLLGTDRPVRPTTVELVRARYPLRRRVLAVLLDIELPVRPSDTPSRPPGLRRQAVGRRPMGRFLLAGAAAAAVLALGTVAAVVLRDPLSPPAAVARTSTRIVTPPATTVQATVTVVPTPTSEGAALLDLQQQVATNGPAVERLIGRWVPEVSAKKPGLVVRKTTYDYRRIWADYRQLAGVHSGALLLNSADFTTFQLPGFWITVVPRAFSTSAAANAWCDSQHIDLGDCFAARLTHSPNSQGNTVLRH